MPEGSLHSVEVQEDSVLVLDADASTASKVDITDPKSRPKERDLYSTVWRWHFYAGILTVPILWIVTLTGALYVFRTELTQLRDSSLLFVTPGPERKSYEELKQIAIKDLGADNLEAISVYPEANRSIHFIAHMESEGEGGEHNERHQHIYINPYTGNILGKKVAEEDFFTSSCSYTAIY